MTEGSPESNETNEEEKPDELDKLEFAKLLVLKIVENIFENQNKIITKLDEIEEKIDTLITKKK